MAPNRQCVCSFVGVHLGTMITKIAEGPRERGQPKMEPQPRQPPARFAALISPHKRLPYQKWTNRGRLPVPTLDGDNTPSQPIRTTKGPYGRMRLARWESLVSFHTTPSCGEGRTPLDQSVRRPSYPEQAAVKGVARTDPLLSSRPSWVAHAVVAFWSLADSHRPGTK